MYDSHLRRGAFVNLIGLLAKLVQPAFLLAVTWMFGTDVVGVYFLAMFIAQVASVLVSAGYDDATLVFASRHADHRETQSDELYRVLSNAFVVTLGLSLLVVAAAAVGVEAFVERFYADRPELTPALSLLAGAVPLIALTSICITATKAVMRMEYDAAIRGFLNPIALLSSSFVVYVADLGLMGLVWAFLLTQALTAVASVVAYSRHYSLSRTFGAIRHFSLDRAMLVFSIPQNVNMTFARYAARLDVIMLGAFGFSNHLLAYYSAAALLTFNLREIKMVFAGALGPIIARYHAASDRAQFEENLNRVSRWTTTLAVPAVLMTLILRDDLLKFLDEGYAGESAFVVVLLLVPFLSCAVGLVGNCILWTRHTGWNLINSVLNASLNTGLNLLLIPSYGLLGAAIATAASATLVSVLQMIELHRLERVALRWKQVHYAYWALGVFLLPWVFLGDPANWGSFPLRIGLSLLVGFGFFAMMLALKHPEVTPLFQRWFGRRRAA